MEKGKRNEKKKDRKKTKKKTKKQLIGKWEELKISGNGEKVSEWK